VPRNPRWSQLGWRGPHPGYLGGLVSEQPVLFREPTLVCYISHIGANPEGFIFTPFVQQATEDGPFNGDDARIEVIFADGRRWRETSICVTTA
jgi:hypothetical protein